MPSIGDELEQERLRGEIQNGREHETAWNVLNNFLEDMRNRMLSVLESPSREISQIETETYILTLRIIKGFREKCRAAIMSAEIAAKNLKESEE